MVYYALTLGAGALRLGSRRDGNSSTLTPVSGRSIAGGHFGFFGSLVRSGNAKDRTNREEVRNLRDPRCSF